MMPNSTKFPVPFFTRMKLRSLNVAPVARVVCMGKEERGGGGRGGGKVNREEINAQNATWVSYIMRQINK